MVVRSGPRGRGPSVTVAALSRAYSASARAWRTGPERIYDRLASVLVAASPVDLAGRTVLDLGAGTGAASRAIEAAGGTPIPADLAIGMVEVLDRRRWSPVVADSRFLPLRDRSVDGAVAAFSLNHVPDPERALVESIRAVRPGGPLLASAYADDDQHPVKAAVDVAAAELGWQPDPWVEELRQSSIPVLATVDGAVGVAERSGLREPSVRKVEVAFPELRPVDLVAWRCGMAQVAPFVAGLNPSTREALVRRSVELLGESPPLVRRVVMITGVT